MATSNGQSGRFAGVTVFGGITMDRIAVSSGRPVMGASNPGLARNSPGGVGFNVATVLSRLGRRVRLIARVGDDSDGRAAIAAAESAGIDVAAVGLSTDAPTASYQAIFDDVGSLVMGIADMGIYETLTPSAAALLTIASEPGDLWVVDANLPEETIDFLVEEAKARSHPVAALAVSPAKALRLLPILDHITYLFANRREAAVLIDRDPQDKGLTAGSLAGELARRGVANVVVTNGEEPLAAATGGDVRSFAPLRARVRGVNGAGDALAAGTIYGLAEGRSLFEAVRSGLAAAAITLESGIGGGSFTPSILVERMAGGQLGPA